MDKAFAEILDPNSQQKQKAASPHPTQPDSRERPSGDEAFDATKLAECWNHAEPEAKLLLVVDYFAQWQGFCHQPQEQEQLSSLYCAIEQALNRLTQTLQQEPQSFTHLMAIWSQVNPNTKLLLVIDQFEELITMSQKDRGSGEQSDSQERDEQKEWQRFLSLLRIALAKYRRQLHIVLTLRSDFEPRFLNSALKVHWKSARFPVRAMNSDELRDAIEGPALKQALYFEPPELVGKLIDEVGQMPGALPLLSFTLSELYIKLYERWTKNKSTDRALRIKDYEELGGVAGALTRRASEEYDNLVRDFGEESGKAHQATMRRVMLRMVTIEGGGVARRRVPESELVYPDSEENKRVAQVSDQLVKARLLVKGQETGEPYVEPAHDFLVRGWGTLQNWIDEEKAQETFELQQRLTAQANDWARNNRPDDLLLPDGDRLNQLEKILNQRNNWFNNRETDYIEKSINDRDERKKQSREQAVTTELLQKANQIDDFLLIQPIKGLLSAIITLGNNLNELPNRVLNQVYSVLLKTIEIAREKKVISNKYNKLVIPINCLKVSQNGQYIVTGSIDGWVSILDNQGEEKVRFQVPNFSNIASIDISPDNQLILIGGTGINGSLSLWNFQGKQVSNFSQEDRNKISVIFTAFSQDNKTLISADCQGNIYLSDKHGNKIKHFPAYFAGVSCLALSSNSSYIAITGLDQMVHFFDLNGKPTYQSITVKDLFATSIKFSPRDNLLAIGGNYGTIELWDVKNQIQIFQAQHQNSVTAIDFSLDGCTMATGSSDCSVRLWNIKAQNWNLKCQQIGQPFYGHKRTITSLAFIPDSNTIITASNEKSINIKNTDYSIRFWDIPQNDWLNKKYKLNDLTWIYSLSFEEDEPIVCGSIAEKTGWYDMNSNLITDSVSNASFKSLSYCSLFKNIWDKEQVLHINKSILLKKTYKSTAFSQDNKVIVALDEDREVYVWNENINISEKIIKASEQMNVEAITVSSDGQTIATGSLDGTIRLWKQNGDFITQFHVEVQDEVKSIAFSLNAEFIVSGYTSGKICLWDKDGNLLGNPLIAHNNWVTHLTFSPDNKWIASASQFEYSSSRQCDKIVCLWQLSWQTALRVACDRLRYHPVFKNPQTEIERQACETCRKYVWSKEDTSV